MPSGPLISVGVPVYNAAAFVGEALESILSQREVNVSVFVSVDGADRDSYAACEPFLRHPRLRIVVQPERLGWARNSEFVRQAALESGAAYGCLHLADDVMADGYLATLLSIAEASPKAAVVYCDIEAFGDRAEFFRQPSVQGSPLRRQLEVLRYHFDAVAWRGLVRAEALARTGPIAVTTWRDFAIDTVWMAHLATAGDLIRVQEALYRKRYHAANTHTAWSNWSDAEKTRAWTEHCVAMLQVSLTVASSPLQRRALLTVAHMRLLQAGVRVGPYRRTIRRLARKERARMLEDFNIAARQTESFPALSPRAGSWLLTLAGRGGRRRTVR